MTQLTEYRQSEPVRSCCFVYHCEEARRAGILNEVKDLPSVPQTKEV